MSFLLTPCFGILEAMYIQKIIIRKSELHAPTTC